MVAASGALVLVGGLGAIAGPILLAALMDYFGNHGLMYAIAVIHGLTGLFAIYRMLSRPPIPLDKQGPSTPNAVHPSGSAIDAVQQWARDETEFEADEETAAP